MSLSRSTDRHLVEELRVLRSRLAKLEGTDTTSFDPEQILQTPNTTGIDSSTENKRTADRLENELRMQANLLDNIPGCIAMIIKKGTRVIVASNKAAKQVGAVPGQTCFQTCAKRDGVCPFCHASDVWNADEKVEIEVEYRGSYYRGVWVPLNEELYVHYIFDITERKEAEEELKNSQEQTDQLNEKLKVLHEVTIELTKAGSTDEVCRLAVELGHKKLGFPRIGIWLKDSESRYQCGTFGIDEKGNIRDERDLRFKVKDQKQARWKYVFFGHGEMIIERDCQLHDSRGKAVGKGSRVSVRMWNGKDSIGIIFVDDLLEPGAITDQQIVAIESFASTVGHLYSQKCAEERIESSLKEKELLLKEVHHRTKNNFQVISSMLYLQSEYFDDEKVFDVLDKCQNRIKSMAAVHEQLYKSQDLTNIDFAEYAHDLLVSLYHSSGISDRSVAFQINIDQVFLSLDQAIPCGLIINELFSNSLEHAFPDLNTSDNQNAKIAIDMHKTSDNEFTLVVSDNGTGFEGQIDSMKGKSLGLYLVKNLIEQLEGSVELDTKNGAKYNIKFPANQA